MAASAFFRINTPRVVHETIDNEVVIIDFDTGSYFSLDNVSATIWNDIAADMDLDGIVGHIRREYRCGDEDVSGAALSFVQDLEQSGLVVAAAIGGASSQLPEPDPTVSANRPYTPPVVNRFADMQQLLLLDPIHDVDETGWPNLPTTADADAV